MSLLLTIPTFGTIALLAFLVMYYATWLGEMRIFLKAAERRADSNRQHWVNATSAYKLLQERPGSSKQSRTSTPTAQRRTMSKTTMKHKAADRKVGMTLTEIQKFRDRAASIPGEIEIRCEVGFRGQIQSLEARQR